MNRVRIASLACPADRDVAVIMAEVTRMVDEACITQIDLICLPEIFAWAALDVQEKPQAAESIDGSVCRQLARLAKKHSVYILAPILERDGQNVFNTAVLLDRQGSLAGTYRKVRPTDYEMEQGITPGTEEFDCFQTEFGPVGCAICFDLNYQEIIARIQSQGCKLVLFPSMFQGIFLMRTWAQLYGLYFVSAVASLYATAIDPLGRVLVKPWEHASIMQIAIDLDYVILHNDHNQEKLSAAQRAYRDQITIETAYLESCSILSSIHPTKTASAIADEFDIETMQEYLERSRQLCRAKLKTS